MTKTLKHTKLGRIIGGTLIRPAVYCTRLFLNYQKERMRELLEQMLTDTETMHRAMREPAFLDAVGQVGQLLQTAARARNTVLIAGNGGSWTDADHFAGELRAQFEKKGAAALPALAVPASLSTLTAWGNDYPNGFETAMARDIEAMGKPGDILIGISTSGKAANVRAALQTARANKLRTVTISGNGPQHTEFTALADLSVVIPSENTARIQEGYQLVIHMLCTYIDTARA